MTAKPILFRMLLAFGMAISFTLVAMYGLVRLGADALGRARQHQRHANPHLAHQVNQ